MTTGDLFDPPAPPETHQEPTKREPKPWHTDHAEHPANRPENALQDGEKAPERWNVAKVEMGIEQMRQFLGWCSDNGIDTAGHSVGSLYVALNAHNRDGFRYLCQALKRSELSALPSAGALHRAMSARRDALLYSSDDDQPPETGARHVRKPYP